MTSQPGKETIATHVLPCMKFGKLIQNITCETFFLKNHLQIVMEKLMPDPFLKNQN